MANYVCELLTNIPDYKVEVVRIPTLGSTDVVHGGSVMLCETLSTVISNNREVYEGEAPAAVSEYPCILLNDGYETLADGRRIEGNPNFTSYTYTTNQVVAAIRPAMDLKFKIGYDALDTTTAPAVGGYVVPVANSYTMKTLAAGADISTYAVAMKIERLEFAPMGGQFGAAIAPSVLVRVVKGR